MRYRVRLVQVDYPHKRPKMLDIYETSQKRALAFARRCVDIWWGTLFGKVKITLIKDK